MKQKVLILCTGNSCRSQMAEGVLRHYGSDYFEVFSAGSVPCIVNPVAIDVMNEIGIDISSHRSKHVDEFKDKDIDHVITVCDHAKSACPLYLGSAKKHHWAFPDPPHNQEITEEVIAEFRNVRDAILEKFKSAAQAGKLEP